MFEKSVVVAMLRRAAWRRTVAQVTGNLAVVAFAGAMAVRYTKGPHPTGYSFGLAGLGAVLLIAAAIAAAERR